MQYYCQLTKIKQFTLRTRHSVWRALFILIMLLVTACQSTDITEEPEMPMAENVTDLSPLLIQAEDMGWSSGYYFIDKELDDLPNFGSAPSQEIWHVIISLIPGTDGGKYPVRHDDIRSGSQTISVFEDEVIAQKEFEALMQHISSLSAGGWTVCDPPPNAHIDNSFARCQYFDTSGLGQLEGCDAQMQLGPYLVNISMVIDGQIITKQDWVNMFEIAQERLVEYVGQVP